MWGFFVLFIFFLRLEGPHLQEHLKKDQQNPQHFASFMSEETSHLPLSTMLEDTESPGR